MLYLDEPRKPVKTPLLGVQSIFNLVSLGFSMGYSKFSSVLNRKLVQFTWFLVLHFPSLLDFR